MQELVLVLVSNNIGFVYNDESVYINDIKISYISNTYVTEIPTTESNVKVKYFNLVDAVLFITSSVGLQDYATQDQVLKDNYNGVMLDDDTMVVKGTDMLLVNQDGHYTELALQCLQEYFSRLGID